MWKKNNVNSWTQNKKQKNRSNKPSPEAKSVTPPNAKSALTKKSQLAVFLPKKKHEVVVSNIFVLFIPTSGTWSNLTNFIFFNVGWFNPQLPQNISPSTTIPGSRMARSRRNGPSEWRVGKSYGRSQRLGELGKTTRVHSTERLSGGKPSPSRSWVDQWVDHQVLRAWVFLDSFKVGMFPKKTASLI